MKGSAITGPVGKEAAELWPVSAHHELLSFDQLADIFPPAYRFQLRCCHVIKKIQIKKFNAIPVGIYGPRFTSSIFFPLPPSATSILLPSSPFLFFS
jgi:hypothetical protein